MADIFISYAREDRELVESLAAQLQICGWTVWWDRRILAGKEFDEVIETEIQAARCVLVVWTPESVKSRWVKVEAGEGHNRGILVPILVGDCSPPLAFRNVQAVALRPPVALHTREFQDLRDAIAELAGARGDRLAPAPVPAQTPDDGRLVPIAVVPAAVVPAVAEVVDAPAVPRAVPAAQPLPGPVGAAPSVTPRKGVRVAAGAAAVLMLVAMGYVATRGGSNSASPSATTPPSALGQPAEPTLQPGPTTTSIQPAEAPPVVAESPAPKVPDGLSSDAIRTFVDDYLRVVSRSDVDALMRFYAPQVVYFGKGSVGMDFVRQDKVAYYRRWPIVSQVLQGEIRIGDGATAGTKVLQYVAAYDVKSPSRDAHASGTITATLEVREGPGGIRIISQQEVARANRQ